MIMNIENVSLSINGKHLVSIPEWKLEEGKMYGLFGQTGIGKSTIGKWMAGVEPVYWDVERIDKRLSTHSDPALFENDLNSSIAGSPLYLLQDAYQIFNPYVSILTHLKDVWGNQTHQPVFKNFNEIYEVLSEIGITDPGSLIKRKVHQVSQGEAQRMAFVLGLIRPAPLRIYDEVFSNVDDVASVEMLSFLRNFCEKSQTSVIIISHETDLIAGFMDEFYEIDKGILKRVSIQPTNSIPPKAIINYPPLITIYELFVPSFKYSTDGEILCHLPEFSMGRSETVGIYGSSGIGKTTLLKGLLSEHDLIWKECKISSNIQIRTYNHLWDMDIRYLPQSVGSAFNPISSLNTSIREIQSVHKINDEEILRLLELFELKADHLKKFPHELSGGEIQRMGIISVLLGDPDLIMLDESFSSVDQTTRQAIWSVLISEQKQKGFALLVVSHDVQWLRENMNRVYELTSGGL